jgi:DNA polymerase-3 subunit gamma/tau
MDVLEIDAASNNGVDNVRDLRDDAVYSPAQVRKRVYIIDEVHMLSISAFNALLKIVEEPPEHLLFILATTELHKVPATILSRCQRFSFRRITPEDIAARLQYVAYQESIDLTEEAARVLARLADGGMRDGLSLLDQCAAAAAGELNDQAVYDCLGLAGQQTCGRLMGYIAAGDTSNALSLFNRLYADGKDISAMFDELLALTRDLLVLKTAPESGLAMLSGVASDRECRALVSKFSPPQLVRIMGLLQQTAASFTRSASRRVDAELCLVNLCEPALSLDAQSLNARLGRLEEQLRSGVVIAASTAVREEEEELPPVPDDADAPPESAEIPHSTPQNTPVGFWSDLVAAVKTELRPPAVGFFAVSPSAPVQGSLEGDKLVLQCGNDFVYEVVNKPQLLELVARKAAGILGRPIRVEAVDINTRGGRSAGMDKLLEFGRQHRDIVTIQDQK